MSVPVWRRNLSPAEYVYKPFRLNIRLAEILANKPKKYKANYADGIIKTALSALKHLQIADSIHLDKNSEAEDYRIRRENLLLARGEIEHVATASGIFLELVRTHDYASENDEKIYKQELEIGEMCESCHELIADEIKKDRELYNRYIKPEQAQIER